MFYKPLNSQLILISVFFTFIIGVFSLAAGDTYDKDQNIDPLQAKVYKQENVSEWWVHYGWLMKVGADFVYEQVSIIKNEEIPLL